MTKRQDLLLLRVSCLRTRQTVFNDNHSYQLDVYTRC